MILMIRGTGVARIRWGDGGHGLSCGTLARV